MSMVDLSVVISNWNTRSLLDQCLRSLSGALRGSELLHEVIVVDDGSTDGSAEMVNQDHPEVRLVLSDANLGYAKANNRGILQAKGRYILLLNSDAVVRRGALEHMVRYLDDHPGVGAVGPKLLNVDGSIQRSCWPFPMKVLLGNAFLLFRLGVLDDYRRWDHRYDRRVDWIVSAALLVRRELFEDVGLFDEHLFVYGVEVEWAKRAANQGWRFVSLAEPEITHFGGQSGLSRSKLMRRDTKDSCAFYFRRHHGVPGLMLYYGLTLSRGILSLAFWWCLRSLGWSPARSRVAWYRESIYGMMGIFE